MQVTVPCPPLLHSLSRASRIVLSGRHFVFQPLQHQKDPCSFARLQLRMLVCECLTDNHDLGMLMGLLPWMVGGNRLLFFGYGRLPRLFERRFVFLPPQPVGHSCCCPGLVLLHMPVGNINCRTTAAGGKRGTPMIYG